MLDIARRGVEPRKDIMPNICQSLATLVLSSSNVMKYIQTELVVVFCFCLLLHNTSISAKTTVEVSFLGNFVPIFVQKYALKTMLHLSVNIISKFVEYRLSFFQSNIFNSFDI